METIQIKQLCKKKKIPVSKMLKDLEVSPSVINSWDKGKEPRLNTIIKIADYLETSIDYIVGRTNEEAIGVETVIINEIKKMTDEQKAKLLADIYKNKR